MNFKEEINSLLIFIITIIVLCNLGGWIRFRYYSHMSFKEAVISLISIDLLALIYCLIKR
jgi:hypothetical protein